MVNHFSGCHPHDLNLSYDAYREQDILHSAWHCDSEQPDWIERIAAYERMLQATSMMYDSIDYEPTYIVKQCPFCGLQMQDSDADDYLHTIPRISGKRFWSINCLEIAGGCGVQMFGDTEEDVIQKWNRRT